MNFKKVRDAYPTWLPGWSVGLCANLERKVITQQDAEKLAKQHMTDYVNACGCQTQEDVANVLMKLASVCGVVMCAVVGNADAVARMQGVTDFIEESMVATTWKCEKAN